MKMRRPRTLLGMVLMGLAFVTVPLLVASINGMIRLGQLAKESEVVLAESATATLQTERLTNLALSMERNARTYVTLKEDTSPAALNTLADTPEPVPLPPVIPVTPIESVST